MTRLPVLIGVFALVCASAAAQWDVSGSADLEVRYFPENPAYDGQDHDTISPSFSFQPEIVFEWNDGLDRLTFEPYLRLDAHDSERTHADIRVGNYLHIAERWETTIGVSRVFWGVTESVHLVDIVNQTDGVEDIDGEDKLGQPMINLKLFRDMGNFSLFVLPGFRARTFPADDARRRGPFSIDAHRPTYDSGAEEYHVDYAIRWSKALGNWDLALSDFYGTSREPRLSPRLGSNGISLQPHYDIINQLGAEVQYTKNSWLWKFEGISRTGHGNQFFAAVGGFEYTLYQILESDADLGLLLEYQYDGRDTDGSAPLVTSDNDIFGGARLALNDEAGTAVLAGMLFDHENHSLAGLVEAERRLSENWKVSLDARLFFHADKEDPLIAVYKDDSINFRMTYSF